MKRGTPEHPKTIDLANRLNVPRYVAVGILESLWHFTSEFAPQGNIGKFTDAAIAGHIHWEKTCKELVTSLIEAKWVDKCSKHRLIVHDWHEHADQTVKRWLEKRGLTFLIPERVTRPRHASMKLANASLEIADPPPQAGLPLPLPLPLPRPLPPPIEMPRVSDFPKTDAAIRGKCPTADLQIVVRITEAAMQSYLSVDHPRIPPPGDAEIAEAVEQAAKDSPKQLGPGLFLKTVPAVIKSWAELGRHPPEKPQGTIYKRCDYDSEGNVIHG